MEKLTLIEQSGLTETKLNSELNRIGLLPQFEHLGISAASTSIPQEIVDFILSLNQPKRVKGSKIAGTRKGKKSTNRSNASIKSMSIDSSAMDTMEPSSIESQLGNIDNARGAHQINQNNHHQQQENITNEGLIQASIEGELTGELEGITYLQAHHKAKQKVLRQYSQFQNQNHNKYIQGILAKYGAINSELSEEIAKEDCDYAEQNKSLRDGLLGKLNG